MSGELKLWCVQIERSIYVLATDQRTAERLGESSEREECGNSPDFLFAREVKDLKYVPEEWRDSLPYVQYGQPDEQKTVEEVLAGMQPNYDI